MGRGGQYLPQKKAGHRAGGLQVAAFIETPDRSLEIIRDGLVVELPAIRMLFEQQVLGCCITIQRQTYGAGSDDQLLSPGANGTQMVMAPDNVTLFHPRKHQG